MRSIRYHSTRSNPCFTLAVTQNLLPGFLAYRDWILSHSGCCGWSEPSNYFRESEQLKAAYSESSCGDLGLNNDDSGLAFLEAHNAWSNAEFRRGPAWTLKSASSKNGIFDRTKDPASISSHIVFPRMCSFLPRSSRSPAMVEVVKLSLTKSFRSFIAS